MKAKILNIHDQDGNFLVTAEVCEKRVQFCVVRLTDEELGMHLRMQYKLLMDHERIRGEEMAKRSALVGREFEI